MTNAGQPIYLVALGDSWATTPSRRREAPNSVHAFGTVADARRCVKRLARAAQPMSAYRIVQYTFSGVVLEG